MRYFWNFVHNVIVHPLLASSCGGSRWLARLHDWTAERMGA